MIEPLSLDASLTAYTADWRAVARYTVRFKGLYFAGQSHIQRVLATEVSWDDACTFRDEEKKRMTVEGIGGHVLFDLERPEGTKSEYRRQRAARELCQQRGSNGAAPCAPHPEQTVGRFCSRLREGMTAGYRRQEIRMNIKSRIKEWLDEPSEVFPNGSKYTRRQNFLGIFLCVALLAGLVVISGLAFFVLGGLSDISGGKLIGHGIKLAIQSLL
ncbi:hypothetical protein [Burkholderia sp. Ac-20365]|uniref:hypothetical protein n=1 Tax=Burkholderia sp. Ac-20365 TaxID=2703897 RepID=UPI00197C1C56|nr:hypothetical protein [Burkholderia sp. Ac-20365]MBN3761015.1 hypothetical protein [Burkholderia sp. Ac-20365]